MLLDVLKEYAVVRVYVYARSTDDKRASSCYRLIQQLY